MKNVLSLLLIWPFFNVSKVNQFKHEFLYYFITMMKIKSYDLYWLMIIKNFYSVFL